MNDASETEEGRIRSGKQLSEEVRINALFLNAWDANGAHLPYGATANITCKFICSPVPSKISGCNYLVAKKPSGVGKS